MQVQNENRSMLSGGESLFDQDRSHEGKCSPEEDEHYIPHVDDLKNEDGPEEIDMINIIDPYEMT